MKKITALLLVVALVASLAVVFAGCSNESAPAQTNPVVGPNNQAATQPQVQNPTQSQTQLPTIKPTTPKEDKEEDKDVSIVGKWALEIDMADMYNQILEIALLDNEEMYDYVKINKFAFNLYWEFKKDGTLIVSSDEDEVEEAIEDFFADFEDGLEDYLADVIEESGEDYTVDELAEEIFGMSVSNYVDMFVESIDMDISDIGTYAEQEYYVEDDRLYLVQDGEEAYITIDLSEDELEFLDFNGEDFDEEDMMLVDEFVLERQ